MKDTGLASHKLSQSEIELNFKEIHHPLRTEEALLEANRCINCYDAPCTKACPTHIDVARFIKQIASRNLKGSAQTIFEANPLGHSCARVCPVEVLCEGSCVYNHLDAPPIKIALLQRYATDGSYARGDRYFFKGKTTGKKAAILGAGPAGLSCASYLARLGHSVTLFEKKPLSGGLNTYGIAEYKMTQKTALEEVSSIEAMGVHLRYGCEVGKDLKVQELEKSYDTIFIGIGMGSTASLKIPGEDLLGVSDAISFIARVKTRKFREIRLGSAVAVIGAGNTAVDAATQAKRLGAEKVFMVYRRGEKEMPAYLYEQVLAKEDGIEFLFWTQPARILGTENVEALECIKTKYGHGKKLETILGSLFKISVSAVIKATGQTAHSYWLAEAAGLKLNSEGFIEVNLETLQTTNSKYFAGGDAINGGKEVVNAAADGKRAAWAIHQHLMKTREIPKGHEYWISTIEGREVAPPFHLNPSSNGAKHECCDI